LDLKIKKKFFLFQQMLSVDGVGPKSAFGIVSFAASETMINAIVSQNLAFFGSIPGIGKKTAQKILLELAGKFNTEFQLKSTVLSADDKMFLDALSSLGFEKEASQKALTEVDPTLPIERRISEAIKLITTKK
jgi:Holliday junction DNA helicase RuvA